MNIYLTIYSILSFFTLLEIRFRKYSSIIFIFFLLFFLILGSIRWNTGTDWDPYYLFFVTNDNWRNFEYSGFEFENGYVLLNYFIKNISDSYSFFLFICSFINISCFYYFSKIFLGGRPIFALLLYFAIFQGGIFVTRQLLATSICLLSTIFIIKRNKLSFFICIAFASLFHISSLIFIISYYLYEYRISVKKFVGILFITILASIFIRVVLENFISLIGDYQRLSGKLTTYVNQQEEFGIINLAKGIVKRILILPVFFYIRKKHNSSNIYNGLLSIYLLGTILYFLFACANLTVFIRISSLFQLMELPLLYYSYKLYRKKWFICFIIIFCAMKTISFYSGNSDLYIPYYTIFDTNIQR